MKNWAEGSSTYDEGISTDRQHAFSPSSMGSIRGLARPILPCDRFLISPMSRVRPRKRAHDGEHPMATIHPEVTDKRIGNNFEPLAVSPRQACLLLGIGNTRLYELLGAGELGILQ